MKMPPEILNRLLRGEHLNVEQRKSLGIWPCETLNYEEIAEYLGQILESEEWFPQPPPTKSSGVAIREGIYIRRDGANRFTAIAQRSRADDPAIMAEKTETTFDAARSAADYYLKWELNLPGRLDGWPVV